MKLNATNGLSIAAVVSGLLAMLGCTSAVPPPSADGGEAGAAGAPATGGTGGSGGAATGPGRLGSACELGPDCASSICVRGRCAERCGAATDCPAGPEWTCALVPGKGTLCQCSESGLEVCDGRDNDCDGSVDDGATCAGELVCEAGACACPGASQCGSACVDFDTDPANCGSCGSACPLGAECIAGTCQCALSNSVCGSRCVDLSLDRENCGTCGNACTPLEECILGTRTCAHTLCSGTCVDTDEDPQNCGRCDHDCAGGACIDGMCQPIELIPGEVGNGVAVDATNVYWANAAAEEIRMASLDGQNVTTIATGFDTSLRVTPIAVNSTGVYWLHNMGVIFGAPFASAPSPCAATPLPSTCVMIVNEYTNGDNTNALAVDETHVYWANYLGKIKRSNLDGSGQVILASGQADPRGIQVHSSGVYWSNTAASYAGVTGLMRMNLDGTDLTTLVKGNTGSALAIFGPNIFWSTGTIQTMPLTGGEVTSLSRGSTTHLIVDAEFIYWSGYGTEFWETGMFKAPRAGGPPVLIAAEGGGMVQDARFIYYTTYETSRLMRLAK
jgi:hypothetical protein